MPVISSINVTKAVLLYMYMYIFKRLLQRKENFFSRLKIEFARECFSLVRKTGIVEHPLRRHNCGFVLIIIFIEEEEWEILFHFLILFKPELNMHRNYSALCMFTQETWCRNEVYHSNIDRFGGRSLQKWYPQSRKKGEIIFQDYIRDPDVRNPIQIIIGKNTELIFFIYNDLLFISFWLNLLFLFNINFLISLYFA